MQVSSHTITILLGLVFCVINPLLAPMCVVYFAIVLTTERYNMLYTERPQYHAGGKVCICAGISVFVSGGGVCVCVCV